MPRLSPEDDQPPGMGLDFQLPSRELVDGRRDRLFTPRRHVVNAGQNRDAVLVARMLTTSSVHHGPTDRVARTGLLRDQLPKPLHRGIGPGEEVLGRLPAADVERLGAPLRLGPVKDNLLEGRTDLGQNAIEDERFGAAALCEMRCLTCVRYRNRGHGNVIARRRSARQSLSKHKSFSCSDKPARDRKPLFRRCR